MELRPLQQPYPPLWYPGTLEIAARRGFNTVVGGPVGHVAKLAARYRELAEEHRDSPDRLNPHVERPVVAGVVRVFLAERDETAVARARQAWAAYTHNITLLWHRAGLSLSDLPSDPSAGGDFDRAVTVGAAVAGSPARLADHVATYAAESGTEHLVVSFAWGDLDHGEVMLSMELFVEHVMARAVQD